MRLALQPPRPRTSSPAASTGAAAPSRSSPPASPRASTTPPPSPCLPPASPRTGWTTRSACRLRCELPHMARQEKAVLTTRKAFHWDAVAPNARPLLALSIYNLFFTQARLYKFLFFLSRCPQSDFSGSKLSFFALASRINHRALHKPHGICVTHSGCNTVTEKLPLSKMFCKPKMGEVRCHVLPVIASACYLDNCSAPSWRSQGASGLRVLVQATAEATIAAAIMNSDTGPSTCGNQGRPASGRQQHQGGIHDHAWQ